MKKLPASVIQRLKQVEIHAKRQMEIMQELQEKDPTLPFVTALIMSGDMEAAERVDAEFQAGRFDFKYALALMGSFARFDWAIRQLEAGKVKPLVVYRLLPHLWSGSDPNDTDPHYLEVWKKARAVMGKIVSDTKRMPDTSESKVGNFTVYRGEPFPLPKRTFPKGISWTTDVRVAVKFARGAGLRRGDMPGEVWEGFVNIKDVLGWIIRRNESEVIVDPACIVRPKRSPWEKYA